MEMLERFAVAFGKGIEAADSRAPIAVNARSGKPFRPGIGPHSESETIRLSTEEIKDSENTLSKIDLEVPYPAGGRSRCDICLGEASGRGWWLEAKMLRFLGDNGKRNDNILLHILSPYPAHRSAVTDCLKLKDAPAASRTAVLIFGYDHERWNLDPAIKAFETIAEQRVSLGPRLQTRFDGLIHPVHTHGRVFAWEVL